MSQFENQVCEKMLSRADFGLKKYGVGVDRTDLTMRQWLVHLQEELMDASIYAERLLAFEEPTPLQIISVLEMINNKLNEDAFYQMLSEEQLEVIKSTVLNLSQLLAGDYNAPDVYEQQVSINDDL